MTHHSKRVGEGPDFSIRSWNCDIFRRIHASTRRSSLWLEFIASKPLVNEHGFLWPLTYKCSTHWPAQLPTLPDSDIPGARHRAFLTFADLLLPSSAVCGSTTWLAFPVSFVFSVGRFHFWPALGFDEAFRGRFILPRGRSGVSGSLSSVTSIIGTPRSSRNGSPSSGVRGALVERTWGLTLVVWDQRRYSVVSTFLEASDKGAAVFILRRCGLLDATCGLCRVRGVIFQKHNQLVHLESWLYLLRMFIILCPMWLRRGSRKLSLLSNSARHNSLMGCNASSWYPKSTVKYQTSIGSSLKNGKRCFYVYTMTKNDVIKRLCL